VAASSNTGKHLAQPRRARKLWRRQTGRIPTPDDFLKDHTVRAASSFPVLACDPGPLRGNQGALITKCAPARPCEGGWNVKTSPLIFTLVDTGAG